MAEIDSLEAGATLTPGERRAPVNVRHYAMMTAAMGIAHSVLLLLAYWLIVTRVPGVGASGEEYIAFYEDPEQRRIVLLAGLYLIPFAGIAFIWFTVSLRMWLTGSVHRLTPLLANLLLACGIIYVALLFSAGASMSVSAATSEFTTGEINPEIARLFPQCGTSILLVFAMRMAAMTVFAMSNIGRTSGVLPKWFSYLGFLLGVLLLSASFSSYLAILFPTWVFLLCIILIDKARHIPRTLEFERTDGRRFVMTPEV